MWAFCGPDDVMPLMSRKCIESVVFDNWPGRRT